MVIENTRPVEIADWEWEEAKITSLLSIAQQGGGIPIAWSATEAISKGKWAYCKVGNNQGPIYIYTVFVNEIPASPVSPDDADLARFSGPIKIAQTLAR